MLARFTIRLAAVAFALGGGSASGRDEPGPPRTLPPAVGRAEPPRFLPDVPPPKTAAEPPASLPASPPATPSATACPPPAPAERLGPPHDYWFSASYLGYTLRPAPLGSPLLTASDAAGTRTLVGESDAKFRWTSGLALTAGFWLNERNTFGFEFGGFLTGRRGAGSEHTAAAGQTLTRPFIDALTGAPARFFVATPGFLTGSFSAASTARLGGADARIVWNRVHTQAVTIDLFAGFRYLDLDEDLQLTQRTRAVNSGSILLDGVTYGSETTLTIIDRFRTRNQFYGGEVGGRAEWRRGPAFVGVTPSVGFGPVRQSVEASGSSSVPGVEFPGGLYAVTGGNAGRDTTTRFAVMSEVRGEAGLYLTGATRLSVGYDFLYLGSVARPGEQIDFVVNTRLVPAARRFGSLSGVASPLPTADRTDFFTHGIRVALEYRY